jgi:hypothetical protein
MFDYLSHRWVPYPPNYHTVPTDDDVFNYRDFTKIPLYMQNATLYDIRKYGVDADFKTSLEDRLNKYAPQSFLSQSSASFNHVKENVKWTKSMCDKEKKIKFIEENRQY